MSKTENIKLFFSFKRAVKDFYCADFVLKRICKEVGGGRGEFNYLVYKRFSIDREPLRLILAYLCKLDYSHRCVGRID